MHMFSVLTLEGALRIKRCCPSVRLSCLSVCPSYSVAYIGLSRFHYLVPDAGNFAAKLHKNPRKMQTFHKLYACNAKFSNAVSYKTVWKKTARIDEMPAMQHCLKHDSAREYFRLRPIYCTMVSAIVNAAICSGCMRDKRWLICCRGPRCGLVEWLI